MQFSIIITCYNQEKFIEAAVNSALGQSGEDTEIIVVDDASSDNSAKLLKTFGGKIQCITLQKNLGTSLARNTGATAAQGDYLVFLDGDDLFLPWALTVYSRIIEAKGPKIILSLIHYFKDTPPHPAFTDFARELQFVTYDVLMHKDRSYRCCASAIVIERDAFNAVEGWSNGLFPSEIDDLMMKMGYSGPTVHLLSHPTIAYRTHAGQTMNQVQRFIQKMVLVAKKERNGEYPGGRKCKYERYAYLGGPVFYWITVGFRVRLFGDTFRLFTAGWQMALVAIWTRLLLKIIPPRSSETINL